MLRFAATVVIYTMNITILHTPINMEGFCNEKQM